MTRLASDLAMIEHAARLAWDGKRLRRIDVVIDEETDGYRIRARCWCWSAMSALIDAPPGGSSEWAGRVWVKRLDAALALAQLPEKIRGYGHVKEKAMDVADERRAQLMAQYGAPVPQRQKA